MGHPGEVPPPALCEKIGTAIARLHKVGTSWHDEFASHDAYERAGHPTLPEEWRCLPHVICDGMPEVGTHSIVQYQLNLLKMVLPEELRGVPSDPAFLEAEVR